LIAAVIFSVHRATEAHALTVNAGDILVGCDNGTIVKVNPLTGQQSLLASGLVGVHDLALSPGGDLYILQHARTVTRLNIASGVMTNITSEGLLGLNSLDTFTAGLALATNGDVYVSVYTAPYTGIVKINPITGLQTSAASGGFINGPIGVGFSPSGELLVADIYNSRVVGVNVTTSTQRLIATNLGGSTPWGMAVDSVGNIYLGRDGASSGVQNILKISSAGAVSVVTTNGLLDDPRDVAIEPGGTLVSCQLGNNSIVRIDPASGNQTLVAAGGLINNTLSLIVANASFSDTPIVVTQPTNQTVLLGSNTSFAPAIIGISPIHYQWYKNGLQLSSATNQSFSLTNVQPSDAGAYWVVATNSLGAATNSPARLFVTMTNPVATPIAMTGWNRDVILENGPTPFAQPFDGPTNSVFYGVWFEEGYNGHLNGLPGSRQFTSAINHPDVVFQLQPYTASNVLWLTESPLSGLTNTLTLAMPKPYVSLSIAAASADAPPGFQYGNPYGSLILNFTDGSHSELIKYLTIDWYTRTEYLTLNLMPFAGLGNQYTTNSGASFAHGYAFGNGIGMYQIDINLLALGHSGKSLASITFIGPRYPSGGGREETGIFAVSGVAADLGIDPPVFLQTSVTNQNVAKASDLSLGVITGGTPPFYYQWQQQSFSSNPKFAISGATNATLVRTNFQTPAAFSIDVRNAAGIVTGSSEINVYFGNLSANSTSFSWGWNFFRSASVIPQQSTNLTDWTSLGSYGNALGFSRGESVQNPQKFFRIVPQ
jgi:streptogramin lyase